MYTNKQKDRIRYIDGKELYELKSGLIINDEKLSSKMLQIVSLQPENNNSDKNIGYEWDEMGMAMLFGELYKQEACYCPEHKSWYVYSEGAWRKDEKDILVSEKIKEFVRLMNLYCGEIENEQSKKDYGKFIKRLGSRRARDNILKDATGELRISATQFDNDPYLINCLNGTYNLKDFTLSEPKWSDFLTMQTNFNASVNRNLRCERWEKFIDEITQKDEEKADFLQRALGYSILGINFEECMFILYGKTTRNGKSTLLNTIQHLLGDYSTIAPVGLICTSSQNKDAEKASPTLARLKGKRCVTMAESNAYGKLDEECIKQLTGGEKISARALYQSPIAYRPQFTMWLSCNDLPEVTDKSLFLSNRLKVIELNKHFSPEEQDTHLKEELTTPENMKAIFMWLVNGYAKYKQRGLAMSDNLKKVIEQYEKDNDIILRFLESRCEKTAESEFMKFNELYQNYKKWSNSEGEDLLSKKRFGSELTKHSEWFKKVGTRDGYKTYYGLKLKEIL